MRKRFIAESKIHERMDGVVGRSRLFLRTRIAGGTSGHNQETAAGKWKRDNKGKGQAAKPKQRKQAGV